jgi:hypothetical protein
MHPGRTNSNRNSRIGSVVAVIFKVLFTWKNIKIIYFLFFKIIFNISASK